MITCIIIYRDPMIMTEMKPLHPFTSLIFFTLKFAHSLSLFSSSALTSFDFIKLVDKYYLR